MKCSDCIVEDTKIQTVAVKSATHHRSEVMTDYLDLFNLGKIEPAQKCMEISNVESRECRGCIVDRAGMKRMIVAFKLRSDQEWVGCHQTKNTILDLMTVYC